MLKKEDILFKKVQQDDMSAFEQIYKYYHPKMFIYSKKFINDDETAKDILQELFLDVWSKRKELSVDISFNAFVFRMLHNRCIDYLRSQIIKDNFASISSLRLAEIKHQYYQFEEDPFPTIFMSEINDIVKKVTDILPQQTREIFDMSRNKGLKSCEIADKMNLSVRTVEKHIYQTLKELKKHLADYTGMLSAITFLLR